MSFTNTTTNLKSVGNKKQGQGDGPAQKESLVQAGGVG